MKLDACTQGRDNNFKLIRFLAAAVVIEFHCYALTDTWLDEPVYRAIPELAGGTLGVFAFFAASGFLVTKSWVERARLLPFVAARALRIYPALVVATLLTIGLAGWTGALPWRDFLADPRTLDYAWRTALSWNFVADLPGSFPNNPFPKAVNGSLWTLPVELRLYLALAIAGVAGVLARRAAWTAAALALFAVLVGWPEHFPLYAVSEGTRLFTIYFGLGSLAYAWRSAVPLSLWGLAAAVTVIALDPWGAGRGALLPVLFTYALLVVAYHPALRWRAFNRLGDYSYGLYILSFPIQQTLIAKLGKPLAGMPLGLLALAFPLTLALAALSWHFIEEPALRLKSRFGPAAAP
jgi:peptidoglycan/LPS O-acetylase OafA/YrhL